MPLALLNLIRLHGKAMLRRSLRGVRTVRGAIFLSLGGLMILMWLASGFFSAYRATRTDPETVRRFFPMWLLMICVLNLVTSAGERAIAFTPPEVDFLFPGPFTRRQLLGAIYSCGSSETTLSERPDARKRRPAQNPSQVDAT